MIEKIMKAVKSGNKKRGKNITVGAVVGMLLSCTVVMGAEGDKYLWLKDDDGEIKISIVDNGEGGTWNKENLYPENEWNQDTKIYINNMTLFGDSNGKTDAGNPLGYGVRLSGDLSNLSFINNGSISGKGDYGSYGIYNNNSTIKRLENNGNISGNDVIYNIGKGLNASASIGNLINSGMIYGRRYGIYNHSQDSGTSSIDNLINSGRIYGSSKGILSEVTSGMMSKIGNLTNSGSIYNGVSNSGNTNIENITNTGSVNGISAGITNECKIASNTAVIENLTNNGSVYSGGYGSIGIYNSNDSTSTGTTTMNSLVNSGFVYGKSNAIKNYKNGTISKAYNYGLLVSSTADTVLNVTLTKNLGLIFKDESTGKYTAKDEDDFKKFGTITTDAEVVIGYEKKLDKTFDFDTPITEKYTIINAKAENNSKDDIKGTESLVLKEGILTYYDSEEASEKKYKEEIIDSTKKYIFNGIKDTIKVAGEDNELNNSTVNAYEAAVMMGEKESILTLNNTIVNGGMKEDTATVNITGEGNNFTVKGDSVINVKNEGTAIGVTGNNNAVVLEGNTIVNGEMKSTGTDNILALNGKADGSMNIFYNISGFADISIDNNVTFFEDMTVTGTNEVTVEGTGVLNLRLKALPKTGDSTAEATHAFSGTDGMIIKGDSKDNTGTLNFITNGIGREILVDMKKITLENMKIKTSSLIDKAEIEGDFIHLGAGSDLDGVVNPKVNKYNSLNKIYKSIYNSTDENLDSLRDILSLPTYLGKNYDYNNRTDEEQLLNLITYLNSIYTETPYSYSSELSRRSVGIFRDIATENEFRPNQDKWLIMGGLTHTDGGTKDTYYGQNYHGADIGTLDTNADMKLTGAYMLAKYEYSENLSLGLTLGGNKSEVEMSASKVKGNSGYLGAFAENYRGNLTLKAGAGVQYSEYDADRRVISGDSYSDKYSDMAYDIYLNGRYSHQVGDNLFLEPYATLSYTYVDQDGANEGNKTLAIETDSKSFDYTVGKVGVDLKKVIPHEKGKSTLSAGVSYTKILDGAEEEYITGRFKGGSDFDILVAHKNEQSIGLNAKYALELENGVVFDVKGSYSVEEDSHNSSSKNKSKGEWIVGAGIGYKF